MTDRKLLELAAKAAGLEIWFDDNGEYCFSVDEKQHSTRWNPLTDDGDALRLAVKLRVGIDFRAYATEVKFGNGESVTVETTMGYGNDEATRRAIVRAAAEIGKTA